MTESEPRCLCLRCIEERGEQEWWGNFRIPMKMTRMIVCAECGNKRCPHSEDHRNACTKSNKSDQPGSRYK